MVVILNIKNKIRGIQEKIILKNLIENLVKNLEENLGENLEEKLGENLTESKVSDIDEIIEP